MAPLDDETARDAVLALRRGDDLEPDLRRALCDWIDHRDERADFCSDSLKSAQVKSTRLERQLADMCGRIAAGATLVELNTERKAREGVVNFEALRAQRSAK